MKALVYEQYGSIEQLKFQSIAEPGAPGPGEVKLLVKAVSLNRADALLLRGRPMIARFMAGLFRPKFNVLGADVAGVVEAVGRGVEDFKVGDTVFGDLSGVGFGGLAERAVAPATLLCKMPRGFSYEEAAAVPMATSTAYQALVGLGRIQPGSKVLINGASGGVGTAAIQIATIMGAEVTGICHSRNAQQALELGAAHVHAYDQVGNVPGAKFDAIIDVAANNPAKHWLKLLAPSGQLVAVGFSASTMLKSITHRQVVALLAKPNADELKTFASWMERGWFKPVITQTIAFEDAIKAFEILLHGKPNGKVVVRI